MLTMKMLGVPELVAQMNAIQKTVDVATVAATRSAQNAAAKRVRGKLRGKPRWNHRGASRIYPQAVNLPGSKNSPRGGPPGRFTGMLLAGVGGKKRLVSVAGVVKGGVGIGGSKLRPNNLKKRKLEAKFPFFEEAVNSAKPEIIAAYATGWERALARRGGL